MSEVLLQSIVEKLEALQIALLKDNNPVKEETIQALLNEVKSFRSDLAKLPLQFEKGSEKSTELLQKLTALNSRLDKPLEHQIKHRHHLNKVVLIVIGLSFFCLLLSCGWIRCHNEKNTFEANDIKYRYLKVQGNKSLLKAIYSTDSLYNLNNEFFSEKVVEKEKEYAGQYELSRIADENKKDYRPGKEFKTRKVHKGK